MHPTSDDRALLAAWLTRSDQAAFHAVVERYSALVQATCRRIAGNGPLADDATQAVFVLLWRKAAGLSADVILAGWLHAAARHASLKAVRGEARRRRREHQAGERSDSMATQPQDPRWADIAPLLDDALASLAAAEREAVVLRHLTGRSWDETAAILGVPRNTAEKRVGRAIERLRGLFARRGVVVPVASLAALLATIPAEAAEPLTTVASPSPAVTQLAEQTARAIRPTRWLPWTFAAGVVLAAGAYLAVPGSPKPEPPAPPRAEQPLLQQAPAGATRLVIRQGHSGSPPRVAVCGSPDGKLIGSCDMFADELRVWDGGQPDNVLFATNLDASAMAFAPDGSGFATLSSFSGSQGISLWSWPAGRLLRRLPAQGCNQSEATIVYLLGGKSLVANYGGGATIYDLVGGRSTPLQPLDPSEAKRLADIVADQTRLRASRSGVAGGFNDLMGRNGSLQNKAEALEAERKRLTGGPFGFWQIAPTLGGTAVAVLLDADDFARPPSLCDARTGQWLRTCEDRHSVLTSHYKQTQARLSVSWDGAWIAAWRRTSPTRIGYTTRTVSVTVWDAASGREEAYLEDPDLSHSPPIVLPDRSALVIHKGAVKRWYWARPDLVDVPGADSCQHMTQIADQRIALYAKQVSDERNAMLGPDRLLDVRTNTCMPWTLGGAHEASHAGSVAIGPGGRLVAAAAPKSHVAVWDLAEARLREHTMLPTQGEGSAWTHLAFADDAQSLHLLSGNFLYDTSIVLSRWMFGGSAPQSWHTGSYPKVHPGNGMSLNGRWAAWVDDLSVRYVDLAAQVERPAIGLPSGRPKHFNSLDRLSLTKDTVLVRCEGNNAVHSADLQAGTLTPLATPETVAVATSSDGQWRLTATYPSGTNSGTQRVDLQELPGGRMLATMPYATSIAFDETSRWFLAITQTDICIGAVPPKGLGADPVRHRLPLAWASSTRTWNYSSSLFGASHNDIRLLPGGRGLLAGQGDGLALVDVASGAEVARLRAWADGRWLITAPDGVFTGSAGIESHLTLIDAAGVVLPAQRVSEQNRPDEMRRRLAAYVADAAAADRLPPLPLPKPVTPAAF